MTQSTPLHFHFKSFMSLKKILSYTGITLLLLLVAWYLGQNFLRRSTTQDFASANGRIEATEIDLATLTPGIVQSILVQEGDWVKSGQILARMQMNGLLAQRDEAIAKLEQAKQNTRVAEAEVAYRESELDAAQRRVARSETLTKEGASSAQELDDDRARVRSATAAVVAAKAHVESMLSNVRANAATLKRIETELADGELKAPRDGRVQYLVAQTGEVLGAGGKVLNLVDTSDVYMTFFLPETVAGKIAIGSEVRILLDAASDRVIPAKVSFVASTAQFTPKTVETASERQKLMFRIKASIDRTLLQKYLAQVKVGLPGVAWIRLNPQTPWPENLADKKLVN
jgi:HlyD family secretion protein